MSLIGAAPEIISALPITYIREIPGVSVPAYRATGITAEAGQQNVEHGYGGGHPMRRVSKTHADIDYIQRATFLLDLWIFWRTVVTVFPMLRGMTPQNRSMLVRGLHGAGIRVTPDDCLRRAGLMPARPKAKSATAASRRVQR